MLTFQLIETILKSIPNRTIGLVGDLFLDRYLDIDPNLDEPSVETGQTAYQITNVRSYPGALGTVVNNLAGLGVGRIYPITIIGDTGEGYELQNALARLPGVELGGVVKAPDRFTPTYTKPMRGNTELNRLDIKNRTPTPPGLESLIIELIDEAWPQFDALLILDQVSEPNCGVITDVVRKHLNERAKSEPEKFILADSRTRLWTFKQFCTKPNDDELNRWMSWITQNSGTTTTLDFELKMNRTVFNTRGADGMLVCLPDGTRTATPGYPVRGPIDTCGAGDSSSAAIACAVVSGATHVEAAAFGNLVASITIQQLGVTGTATPEQVRNRFREVSRISAG